MLQLFFSMFWLFFLSFLKFFFQHGSDLTQESEEGGKEEGGIEGEFFLFLPDCF